MKIIKINKTKKKKQNKKWHALEKVIMVEVSINVFHDVNSSFITVTSIRHNAGI